MTGIYKISMCKLYVFISADTCIPHYLFVLFDARILSECQNYLSIVPCEPLVLEHRITGIIVSRPTIQAGNCNGGKCANSNIILKSRIGYAVSNASS